MIRGIVTADRAALVRLAVCGPGGREQEVEAIVDTGFDGWLSSPPAVIARLGLQWRRRGRALLADGSECVFDMYEEDLERWERQVAEIEERRRGAFNDR